MRFPLLLITLCVLPLACVRDSGHRICVLDFEVISPEGEHGHLAQAIPEFMTNELNGTTRLHVQDPQDARRHLTGRSPLWSMHDLSRLQGLGRSLGTDYFILGSVSRLGGAFVLESRLFSVSRGHVVPGTAVRETCSTEHDILIQVRRIADQMEYQILARTPPQGGANVQ